MSVSIYKLKKWYKMLAGKSISHINQGVGTCYSKTEIAGYYNDLTEKVTKDDPSILVPKYHIDTGEEIYFSIGIFQYGLASYDLFLTTRREEYRNKLIACANWAVDNQQEDGSWVTFSCEKPNHPYSSMAQGEGISMLLRAFLVSKNEQYLRATHKAKDFMLKPLLCGGTTSYLGEDVILHEYTDETPVLNGWIFSLWGLFDYYKFTKSEIILDILKKTLRTLSNTLPEYDLGYWSNYDLGKRITSPFYHKLHIAQLATMYDLFGDDIYKEYSEKWEKYQNSFWYPKIAFLKKAIQKIGEK